MPERATTCRICGAQLGGRDVYEGICANCREEEILAGTPVPKKPAPPNRSAPAEPTAPSPADRPPIDMDADTRELLALEDRTEVEFDSGRSRDLRDAEDLAEGVIRFTDTEPTQPVELPRQPPAATQAAAAGPDALPLPTDTDDELPVTEVAEAEPPKPAVAQARAAESAPAEPAAELEVAELVERPPRRSEARLEPPPPDLAVLDEEQAPPSVRPRAVELPRPDQQAAPASEATEEPPRIRLRLEGESLEARRGEATPASLGRPHAIQLVGRQADRELSARLDRLLDQLERLTRELKRGGAGLTPRQQFYLGFRAFFGFVLGLGALAVVVLGLMGLIGLLIHPPLLELLRSAARGLFGG